MPSIPRLLIAFGCAVGIGIACGPPCPGPGCPNGEVVCEGAQCSCPSNEPCALDCTASCDLNCTGSGDCDFICIDNCSVTCSGSGLCTLDVGPGSDVVCSGSGDCDVTCGGPCTVDCPGSGDCDVACPPELGAAQQCGDLLVCGDCP